MAEVETAAKGEMNLSAPSSATDQERAGEIATTFKNRVSNVALALFFFIGLLPSHTPRYALHSADIIWMVGAGLMGIFSLVRVTPKAVMLNAWSISATAGMMLLPMMIKAGPPSIGILNQLGIAIELIGVVFTQLARIYLGRSFGLLPANRGIVSTGPFRLMRHPIYVGWLLLTLGHSFIYPTPRNFIVMTSVLPFMMWRIVQEEALLSLDPEYREYCARVRSRLIPGIF